MREIKLKNSGNGHKKKVHKAAKIYRQEIGNIRILREDIIDYGTLSDYTLRRIANLENSDDINRKKAILEISAMKDELGEDYLQKEKERQKDLSKEIIIAIENQKII